MNGMMDYSYRASIRMNVPLSCMSGEDKIRLVKDLVRDLLLTDGLREEYREELQKYLQIALEESKK